MGKYIITYDLYKPQQDYTGLINCLKLYSAYKATESCWLLASSLTAKEIRDNLRQYLDPNDRILVAALTGESAWQNLIASSSEVRTLLSINLL